MDGKYISAAFKIFLVLAAGALLLQLVSFGFYWYTRRNFPQRDFNIKEKERCERVLAGEGDLTDLSYCKKFMEWLRTNSDPNQGK